MMKNHLVLSLLLLAVSSCAWGMAAPGGLSCTTVLAAQKAGNELVDEKDVEATARRALQDKTASMLAAYIAEINVLDAQIKLIIKAKATGEESLRTLAHNQKIQQKKLSAAQQSEVESLEKQLTDMRNAHKTACASLHTAHDAELELQRKLLAETDVSQKALEADVADLRARYARIEKIIASALDGFIALDADDADAPPAPPLAVGNVFAGDPRGDGSSYVPAEVRSVFAMLAKVWRS